MLASTSFVTAQSMFGTTGLLTIPSAEMQEDKTVMLGVGFLNETLTPRDFNYHTGNYYLNVTILPCLEVAYSCTLFRGGPDIAPHKPGKIVNQDRAFSARFRPLKEGKYHPAVVIGGNDVAKTNQLFSKTGNSYFRSLYVAATKHLPLGREQLGVHLAYGYRSKELKVIDGFSLGVTYNPTCAPNLSLIAEGSSKTINFGATYLFFDHLFVQCVMQHGKYISGGLTYKIYLK